ncbi:MAG: hypothetical protein BAA01_05070 [Bacillus thermozeamaize]|uniref:DUF4411 domain-containing protein n=1 Tax=Bacillus thermozeamaize TaxID=230954 RepID=A0A1Y3PR72_9BACI|nr:MAG: hypothetical protein BAA01_05070 [Bacillus thermozeamaize]
MVERTGVYFFRASYVIALAKVKKAVVITGEIPADPKAKKIKMPDVCMKMGVDWANFLQFIRREGWRF